MYRPLLGFHRNSSKHYLHFSIKSARLLQLFAFADMEHAVIIFVPLVRLGLTALRYIADTLHHKSQFSSFYRQFSLYMLVQIF